MNRNLANWILRRVLELAGDPPIRVTLWNGVTQESPRKTTRFDIEIRDPKSLLGLLVNPQLYFGDAYAKGSIHVKGDLVEFLEMMYTIASNRRAHHGIRQRLMDWQARPRRNTLVKSRKHIHHHYDLGNDFYRLWLDDAMQYTCAYYPQPDASLETAQIAKIDHVCRKLQLAPGDRVAEAGSGWGGLALHMAKHYGARVRSYNIAHEQVVFARERAKALGLEDQVEFIEDDYRNITGEYDVFASVGMLEHVGRENYGALGEVINRVLTPQGRGLIHTIGRTRAKYMNPWIERRIFPGAYPPSLREMMAIFEPSDFSVQDVENIRLHYVKTLEHWLERFERHREEITAMYDPEFVRIWRLYLCGSIAAFKVGALQLFQVVFTRQQNNTIPWTRAHLYQQPPTGQREQPHEVNAA